MRVGIGIGVRRGGSPVFAPGVIAPGYTVDLNAALLGLAEGADVLSVANAGSAGGTFAPGAASTRPLYRVNGLGASRAGIDFDGVDDYLESTVLASGLVSAGAWTVIASVYLDGLAAGSASAWLDATLCEDVGGNLGCMLRDNAGTPQVGCYRFGGSYAYATMQGAGAAQIVAARYDGSTTNARHNLDVEASAAGSGSALSGMIRVGAYHSSANCVNGKLARLFVWARALSLAEMTSFITAFGADQGIAV